MIRRLQSGRVQALQEAGNEEPEDSLPAQVPLAAPVSQNGSGLAVGELGWYGAAIYRLLAGDPGAFRCCLREVVQLRGKLRRRAQILWSLSFLPWILRAAYRRRMGGKSKYLRYYKAGQMSLNIPE
jgi:hypothetical protein